MSKSINNNINRQLNNVNEQIDDSGKKLDKYKKIVEEYSLRYSKQINNYIFFVCELIKQIIVIIIVLFYTCGYYYTNKVEPNYEINGDILAEIYVSKIDSKGNEKVEACNEIIQQFNNNQYNFFDFIENIHKIKNQCTSNESPKEAGKEDMMIKPNIAVIQMYTHLFSDTNLIFGILMIIVYVLSQTLIPKNYTHNINNIFSDLLVKISTIIVFVPILLLYLYSSVYSLVFIFQNVKKYDNLITKLFISGIGLFMMYVIMLLFIGILYLYKLSFKGIYGHVRRVHRNSLALNIDKAIDIFFNFDAKIKKNKDIAIMNTVFMGVGFFASIGILFYSSSFKEKILPQFCSPGRLPSYPQFFEVIKQFVCDEKSSLVIKNVTRILLSVFVVLMAFQLLPIAIAIFALVVVIYLIYKSFSYLMNIEC
jgi:hypothetical protein